MTFAPALSPAPGTAGIGALRRKAAKALHALATPTGRRGLRLGAAPALEHRGAFLEVAEALGGADRLATLVDVGANRGQFALAALAAFPAARLHGFEPLPGAADAFGRLFEGEARVTLHRLALGPAEATAALHETARADSSSLLAPARQAEAYPGAAEVVARPSVRVRRFDALGLRIAGPALLKLDVQGYELGALEGFGATLEAFSHVYAELSFVELYAGQPLAHEVVAWLAERGFRLASVHMGDGGHDAAGRALQGDFLFTRG